MKKSFFYGLVRPLLSKYILLIKHDLTKKVFTHAFVLSVIWKIPDCNFKLDIWEVLTSYITEDLLCRPHWILRRWLDFGGKTSVTTKRREKQSVPIWKLFLPENLESVSKRFGQEAKEEKFAWETKSLTHKYSTVSKHRVQAEPQICSFQSFSNPLQTKWSPPDSCPQSTKPFESTHLIVAELW